MLYMVNTTTMELRHGRLQGMAKRLSAFDNVVLSENAENIWTEKVSNEEVG